MFLAVFQEGITLFDCKMSIISYPVHWLILYLLRTVCCFFFFWIIVACMFVAVYTRSVCFVCLWNDYYRKSRSLIDSLLVLICMLFLLIWIIIAGVLVAVLPEANCLYDCRMIIFLYLDHWLIFHLLQWFKIERNNIQF